MRLRATPWSAVTPSSLMSGAPPRARADCFYHASRCRRGQGGGPCRNICRPICQSVRSAIFHGYPNNQVTEQAVRALQLDMPLLRPGESWAPYPLPRAFPLAPAPPPPLPLRPPTQHGAVGQVTAGGSYVPIRGTAGSQGTTHAPRTVVVPRGSLAVTAGKAYGQRLAPHIGSFVPPPPPPTPPARGRSASACGW